LSRRMLATSSLEKKRGSLTSKNTLENGNGQGQVNHYRKNVRDPTGQPKGINWATRVPLRSSDPRERLVTFVHCSLYHFQLYDFQRAIGP